MGPGARINLSFGDLHFAGDGLQVRLRSAEEQGDFAVEITKPLKGYDNPLRGFI